MHLLAAQPGGIADGSSAIDLGQSPGDIVVLSAADTELAGLAAARRSFGENFPSLRLANLMNLTHNLSVDTYVEDVVRHARLVVLRLLGGVGYWPYGVEQIARICRENDVALAALPGDDQPDAELDGYCNLPREACHRLWLYRVHGGGDNDRNFLAYAASLTGHDCDWINPRPLLRAGLYWPGRDTPAPEDIRVNWQPERPTAALVFYRALLQGGSLAPVDAMISALAETGLNPLPVYVSSLKDSVSAGLVEDMLARFRPSVILNATGFAVASPGETRGANPFDGADCPVLQLVFAGGTEAAWREQSRGLSPRDLAMNVVLPEVDGRILSRAVSFKTEARFDALTQIPVTSYKPVPDRIAFTAKLAAAWARLRNTPTEKRRVALILANYPNKDGRIGNGVGLDTPASIVNLLRALNAQGYGVAGVPEDGNALMRRLTDGPTNKFGARKGGVFLTRANYETFFETLPTDIRNAVVARWGVPSDDPFFMDGGFVLSVLKFGNVIVGVQPARGYNIDPVKSYHDPDLVPPHGYFAFYAWLRRKFDIHAVIHMGKHGNLEWLPGKAVALSENCYPEAALGPLPHIYPFIVNDPGEGTQAKRRAAAVIADHLTPPLTRAESYGPLRDLEALVDEYYEASGVDPRRLEVLRQDILDLTQSTGLDKDCGIEREEDQDRALAKLDNYLCELKEMQIRDGLHIFGKSPEGDQLTDLLIALTRVPRADGKDGDASLIRALAADLDFGDFDPLDCEMAAPWSGAKPDVLTNGTRWRSNGDTVERLETLAQSLIAGNSKPDDGWQHSRAVLSHVEQHVRPNVAQCGTNEIDAVLKGLDGRFVPPGPSGAPTRGRLDVLPTGRNFYSVDTRTVPTPAAWTLGWKSANLLLARHRQEHGAWPRAIALSAWGTSNMRTGGEDIAQALALLGVRPRWDTASRRVTGFEILPASVLDRPRVDVTLRISGFFRDAFPSQIDLFDSAVRAVAELHEDEKSNPLAARVQRETAKLMVRGIDESAARQRAGYRVFGSKPGAYGAGLQALIDERGWRTEEDLARAYIAWGGYAYGGGAQGTAEHGLFERRLEHTEIVVHNQDNREHDLLDSDDYYQFEGGMTAAVRMLSGTRPVIYHNDHSRPESPKIRTLEEEIARTVRARVVNPKWIAGVMRHGYKGAFEIAATVDYLFAFAATTGLVADHHFDAVYDAYGDDATGRDVMTDNFPAAAHEMAQRLMEALDRNLWRPKSNTAYRRLSELAKGGTA